MTDPDRAAVVGAAVVLIHAPSSAQQTGLTRDDGTLQIEGLPLGEYRVEITALGFALYTQTVTLGADGRALDIALEIAGVREEITVEGVATVPTIGRIRTPLRDQPLTVNTLTSAFLEAHAINDVVLLNLGASYTRGRVQMVLNLNNVTDEVYWTSSLGNRQLYPGQPFNVIATVRVRTN